jgi:hypothetical protein
MPALSSSSSGAAPAQRPLAARAANGCIVLNINFEKEWNGLHGGVAYITLFKDAEKAVMHEALRRGETVFVREYTCGRGRWRRITEAPEPVPPTDGAQRFELQVVRSVWTRHS